jgi:hypothetical protein
MFTALASHPQSTNAFTTKWLFVPAAKCNGVASFGTVRTSQGNLAINRIALPLQAALICHCSNLAGSRIAIAAIWLEAALLCHMRLPSHCIKLARLGVCPQCQQRRCHAPTLAPDAVSPVSQQVHRRPPRRLVLRGSRGQRVQLRGL